MSTPTSTMMETFESFLICAHVEFVNRIHLSLPKQGDAVFKIHGQTDCRLVVLDGDQYWRNDRDPELELVVADFSLTCQLSKCLIEVQAHPGVLHITSCTAFVRRSFHSSVSTFVCRTNQHRHK